MRKITFVLMPFAVVAVVKIAKLIADLIDNAIWLARNPMEIPPGTHGYIPPQIFWALVGLLLIGVVFLRLSWKRKVT